MKGLVGAIRVFGLFIYVVPHPEIHCRNKTYWYKIQYLPNNSVCSVFIRNVGVYVKNNTHKMQSNGRNPIAIGQTHMNIPQTLVENSSIQ